MNVFWMVIGLSVIVSSIHIPNHEDMVAFIAGYVLLPTVLMSTFMLFMEWAFRRYSGEKIFRYFIIICALFISSTLIWIHYTVDTIWGALVLPLLVSCIYYRKNKIIFASVSSALAFILIYFFHPEVQGEISYIDFLTMLSVLFGGCVVCLGTMKRGLEIVQHLKESMDSSQELMASKVLMEKMAKTDALTGMNNHLAFHQFLDDLLQHGDGGSLSLHLALIDIDNFKKVNDTFGHHTGDVILRFVSEQIGGGVTLDDFAARYGGEEFAIIFVDKTHEEVYSLLEDIRTSVANVHHQELNNQRVTVSIGLGVYIPGEGKNHFFEKADNALYAAKRTGKNKINLFSTIDSTNSACL